ncbi:hypothetical protein AB6A40_007189 [Gnathostoma spinigerum]|uniref:ABC transmembrane type-1 domain-containing protein n=1 Tax=Gnathostoma spinigerum TaxID=75299 RepID=A0ABD6EKH7_9BILA
MNLSKKKIDHELRSLGYANTVMVRGHSNTFTEAVSLLPICPPLSSSLARSSLCFEIPSLSHLVLIPSISFCPFILCIVLQFFLHVGDSMAESYHLSHCQGISRYVMFPSITFREMFYLTINAAPLYVKLHRVLELLLKSLGCLPVHSPITTIVIVMVIIATFVTITVIVVIVAIIIIIALILVIVTVYVIVIVIIATSVVVIISIIIITTIVTSSSLIRHRRFSRSLCLSLYTCHY